MRLNLGSGYCNKEGYENIDAVYGQTLPGHLKRYAAGSIDEIFTEHFLEHLTWNDGLELVRQCYRIMKPGAVFRISVPSLEKLVEKYLEKDIRHWAEGWLPATPCAMLNEGMREWGHLYLYDKPELERLLRLGGFTQIEFTTRHQECLRGDFGELFAVAVR